MTKPTEQEVIKRILDWVEEDPWKEQFEVAWCLGYQAAILKAQKLLKIKPDSTAKEIVLGLNTD